MKPSGLRGFLRDLGPGLISGAADDDPSGIATFSVAGASFGYLPLWTALFSIPLMIAAQTMSARLGMVSGRGLAAAIRANLPRWVLWGACSLLVVANVINISADLAGMAESSAMVTPIRAAVWMAFYPLLIIILLAWSRYCVIASVLKWLTLVLFSYVFTAFLAHADWSAVLRYTLLPRFEFSRHYLAALVAILGTSISPYLFFWQASQEVEEERSQGKITVQSRQGATAAELSKSRKDVVTGMIFSNLIVYFIIVTTAATLHAHGQTTIGTARQAAEALRPLAGSGAYWLFTAGIIGTGMLAVPVLAGSCAYAVAEGATWRASLEDKPKRAREFYAVLGLALLIGWSIDYLKLNPIRMLFFSAVINGLLAPPLIAVLLVLTGSRKVMGDHANPRWLRRLGWLTFAVMAAAAIALLATR